MKILWILTWISISFNRWKEITRDLRLVLKEWKGRLLLSIYEWISHQLQATENVEGLVVRVTSQSLIKLYRDSDFKNEMSLSTPNFVIKNTCRYYSKTYPFDVTLSLQVQ
jgi:hypothetical protein